MKHVCILNGIHQGAVVAVGDGPVLVGGDERCDSLLSDPSARSSVIRLSTDSDKSLAVETVEGEVLRNGRRLRAGRIKSLDEGTVIEIGGVQLAAGHGLDAARGNAALREKRRMMMNWSGVGAACLAIFAIIGIVGGPADAYNSFGSSATAKRLSGSVATRSDPLAALSREMDARDLSDRITVQRSDTGRFVATGAVDGAERERWEDLVRWFDGRFGDVATLLSNLTERNDGYVMPFRIGSIHPAPNPRVVLRDGRAFPVGSILPGGWELRGIDGSKIDLVRGGESLSISF